MDTATETSGEQQSRPGAAQPLQPLQPPPAPTGGATGLGPATGPAAGATIGGRAAVTTGLWGRTEQQDFRSRVRGTLLGSAIGDALGAPVAALSLPELLQAHGPSGLTEPPPARRSPPPPSSACSPWTA